MISFSNSSVVLFFYSAVVLQLENRSVSQCNVSRQFVRELHIRSTISLSRSRTSILNHTVEHYTDNLVAARENPPVQTKTLLSTDHVPGVWRSSKYKRFYE